MDKIFQASDLVNKRLELLDAARTGRARLRDKDGTSLVMLPESELELLEELARWGRAHLSLERLISRGGPLTVDELGDLAWLRVFEVHELREFLDELHQVLIAAHADRDIEVLRDCVCAWRTTARQLGDPLRRSVLRGPLADGDLVEAKPPEEPDVS